MLLPIIIAQMILLKWASKRRTKRSKIITMVMLILANLVPLKFKHSY